MKYIERFFYLHNTKQIRNYPIDNMYDYYGSDTPIVADQYTMLLDLKIAKRLIISNIRKDVEKLLEYLEEL